MCHRGFCWGYLQATLESSFNRLEWSWLLEDSLHGYPKKSTKFSSFEFTYAPLKRFKRFKQQGVNPKLNVAHPNNFPIRPPC